MAHWRARGGGRGAACMDGRGGGVCGAVGRTTARQQCSVVFQAETGAENTGRACVGCGVKFFFFLVVFVLGRG